MHGPVQIARDAAGAIYVAEHGDTLSNPTGAGGAFVSKYTVSGNTATRVWRRGGSGTEQERDGEDERDDQAGHGVDPGSSTFASARSRRR